MKVRSIRFKNYKAFKEQQELLIKPITVLIGRNSSGKSAVARLPLLLAQSLKPASNAPIELQFDNLEFGGSFKDLVHNRLDHGSVSFGITVAEGAEKIDLDVIIQNIADSPLQVISKYTLTDHDSYSITMEWVGEISPSKGPLYKTSGLFNAMVYIKFNGLLIDTITDVVEDKPIQNHIFEMANFYIQNSFDGVDYIGPFRDLPKRDYIYKGSMPKKTGYSGELAPQMLGIDSYLDKQLIEQVGAWYEKNLGGWKLEVNKARDKFEIVLVSPDSSNVKVNLVDVGHGMSQVLPLIVRSFFKPSISNTIMIIEQPELHLHPAAHGGLAEQIISSIQNEKSNWIIETHSEIFLLRIRRMIAEGKLDPNDVIIYLINDEARPGSHLSSITISKDGEVSEWPKGVFAEDFEEVVAIRKAQQNEI